MGVARSFRIVLTMLLRCGIDPYRTGPSAEQVKTRLLPGLTSGGFGATGFDDRRIAADRASANPSLVREAPNSLLRLV